ncbi:hypothetical protein D3C78_1425650 [compost metagenome]
MAIGFDLAIGIAQLFPDRLGVTQALAEFGDLRRLAAVLLFDAFELVVEGRIKFALGGLAAVQCTRVGLLIGFNVVARGVLVFFCMSTERQQHQDQAYHRSHLRHSLKTRGYMGADSRSALWQRTG